MKRIANALLQNRSGQDVWVGGTVEIADARLIFTPNHLNVLLNSGDLQIDIPLSQIVRVARRFAFVSGIVDVDYGAGDLRQLSFRCFGAKSLATAIRKAAYLASH